MEEKITVTRTMVQRFSLAMMILITIWGSVLLYMFKQDKKEALSKAEELHKEEQNAAVERERKAILKRDSIYFVSTQNKNEVISLKNEVKASIAENAIRNEKYQTSLNEFKKSNNEKAYIPSNPTAEQRADFLSKYKYEPY